MLEAFWEAELALGRHVEAVPELGRLTQEHPLQEGWWALHALALYRAGRQGDALESLRSARRVLDDQLGVEPGTRLRELEQAILAQDPSLDLGSAPTAAREAPAPVASVTGCPYKGLARYELDDAAVFRGRERLVRMLVTSLVDRRLLVVSGSSGAGKSSVVRAGLLPALGSGELPSSAAWRPVVVVPGRQPVDTLASLTGRTHRRHPWCSSATSSSSCGQTASGRGSARPSSTPCWACCPTRSWRAACWWCAVTTSAGWPSTRTWPGTCTAPWSWCPR